MFEFNKKLIFKKFFLDNTYYFLLSIFCVTLIVWVIQAVNYLDFVIEDGRPQNDEVLNFLNNLSRFLEEGEEGRW